MKYVFLINDIGYNKYICNSARKDKDVIIYSGVTSGFKDKLLRIHTAWKLNKHIELPFKKIWYKMCFDEKAIRSEEEVIFLIYEGFYFAYSKKYIKHLKTKYKNSKFVFVMLNPMVDIIWEKIKALREYYDNIITFNKNDAEKYELNCYENGLFGLDDIQETGIEESDVFFVGMDKGRLPILLKIHKKLSENGIKCDFHVVGVRAENIVNANGIVYNKKITYEEVLERVKKTKCVLEIIQNGENYASLRTLEAYALRKKLLTTNLRVVETEYYDEKIIQTINDVDEIDISFINEQTDKKIYQEKEFYSFTKFKKYLKEIF